MEFAAESASLFIDYNVRISINEDGVRVFNDYFSRLYRHGPMPRSYSAKRVDRRNVVVIQNVGDPVGFF